MTGKHSRKIMIALNVLYAKSEKVDPAYFSKQNSKCEKQDILSMIPNGETSDIVLE